MESLVADSVNQEGKVIKSGRMKTIGYMGILSHINSLLCIDEWNNLFGDLSFYFK